MKLRNDISGISGQETEANDENDGTRECQHKPNPGITQGDAYGARPREARVAGRDKTPSETDSAIMTSSIRKVLSLT